MPSILCQLYHSHTRSRGSERDGPAASQRQELFKDSRHHITRQWQANRTSQCPDTTASYICLRCTSTQRYAYSCPNRLGTASIHSDSSGLSFGLPNGTQDWLSVLASYREGQPQRMWLFKRFQCSAPTPRGMRLPVRRPREQLFRFGFLLSGMGLTFGLAKVTRH